MSTVSASRRSFVARGRILGGFVIAGAVLLIVRLFFIQIVHGGQYRVEAIGQYTAEDPETPARDSIFFTTKDGTLIPAAIMQTGWRIAINPKLIANPAGIYEKLSGIAPIDRTAFLASAAKRGDSYEEVALRVDDKAAEKIRSLKIAGVMLVADYWRVYPGDKLAAQTLGFVGYAEGATARSGRYGLEQEYDETLTEHGNGLYVNPFAEVFTNLRSALSADPAREHGSIVTSIEPQVQSQLEKTLEEIMAQYSPELAGGIIMDPNSGAIYAIGARPTFDPNDYGSASDPAVYQNPLVSGRYELGSIMKPLTMAAAIDSGAVTPDTTYNDTGCASVSGATICNYDSRARGVIPMQEILSQSLNVGASWVATKTGYPIFTKYMKAFGLGGETRIDLPDETTGDLSNLDDGQGPAINFDTASYGQGISVSPIAMARALSALANGGTLPPPHVAVAVRYDDGITRSLSYSPGLRVISTSTSQTVSGMLAKVYDEALGKGKYKMAHYTAAAKTGTAQIPKPGGGYFQGNVFLHSFFGYFPATDPRFIVFLFAKEPRGVEYASASLAPAYYELEQFLINYYDLPPDR